MMIDAIKELIAKSARKLGIAVLRQDTLQGIKDQARVGSSHWLALETPPEHALLFLESMEKTQAERWQDLLALSQAGFKRGGYFIEFGANDGRLISNTYMLEKEFGWTGILAEPIAGLHDALRKNRPASHIETDCVWSVSGEVISFNEADVSLLSTVETFRTAHGLPEARLVGTTHQVPTISLLDLLNKYEAPGHIDFLSVDTEGSECEILRTFDFSKYTFSVIVCEHNYAPQREQIFDLLTSHGYRRVFEERSECDDYYVREASAEES